MRRGHHRSCFWVDVGCEGFAERVTIEVEVSALAPVRPGERHGPDRRPHEAAFEPLKELLLAFALVAHPAVEVDERLDLVVADGGHRDDVAATAKGIANDERGFLLTGDPIFISEARARIGLARTALGAAVRSAATDGEKAAVRAVSQGFETWVTAVQKGFTDYGAGRQAQAVAASVGSNRELRKTYDDSLAQAQALANSSEHAATTSLTRRIHHSLTILLVSLAIALAIGLRLAFWLVRSVALPVYRILEILGGREIATDPGHV